MELKGIGKNYLISISKIFTKRIYTSCLILMQSPRLHFHVLSHITTYIYLYILLTQQPMNAQTYCPGIEAMNEAILLRASTAKHLSALISTLSKSRLAGL